MVRFASWQGGGICVRVFVGAHLLVTEKTFKVGWSQIGRLTMGSGLTGATASSHAPGNSLLRPGTHALLYQRGVSH